MAANMLGDEFSIQSQALDRRRQMAQALMQSQMPQGKMVGRHYVGASPLEYLASGLKQFAGRKDLDLADKEQMALGDRMRTQQAGEVQGYVKALKGTGAAPTGQTFDVPANEMDQEGSTQQQFSPAVPGDPDKALAMALASRNPMLQQLGANQLKESTPKNVVVGRSLINNQNGQVVGTDATWKEEQEAARQAKAAELQAKLNDQRISREERAALQRELAEMQIAARRDMVQLAASLRPERAPQAPVAVMGPDNQPVYVQPSEAVGKRPASKTGENKLPTSALKMQQEEVEAIGIASALEKDLGALEKQVTSGDLKLGPVQNLVSKGRNVAGMSDPNSRNFQSFMATLERMRNDSLRLNKGVQTEGDAQRVWNELIANVNDGEAVKQRLKEIRTINQRAVSLRRMNIDQIRSNFGVPTLDTSRQENVPPAVGGGAAAPASSGFRIIEVK